MKHSKRNELSISIPLDEFADDHARGFLTGSEFLDLHERGATYVECECNSPFEKPMLVRFVWICDGQRLVCTGCGADGT